MRGDPFKTAAEEFLAFEKRMIRSRVRRARRAGDVPDLAAMIALQDFLKEATVEMAHILHDAGFSWTDIGKGLGINRVAAFRKFRRIDTATEGEEQ